MKPTPLVRAALPVWFALALFTSLEAAGQLSLTPVGNPVPGFGPVGIAVANTPGGTYTLVGDYQGDTVRSLRMDRSTGGLVPVGNPVPTTKPAAIAMTRDGRYAVVANQATHEVTSLRFDPATGGLVPIGSAPSGGKGPTAVAISKEFYVLSANRDSNNVGVLRLDPSTGGLVPVGSTTVGTAPSTIRIADSMVVVGHAVSNDVHLLRFDRSTGALAPVGSVPVGARVASIAIDSVSTAEQKPGTVLERGTHRVFAATFPDGDVHEFRAGPRHLVPIGSFPSGGDLTAVATDGAGGIFAAGAQPGRLASFDVGVSALQPTGALPLSGLSSRTLAVVPGTTPGTWFVIVNEYNNNQTLVVRGQPQ